MTEVTDIEIIDANKRPLFEKYTGFSNLPFDPQGRLTSIRIELLKSAREIVKCFSETAADRFARVVLVAGAAGIGKSVTAQELGRRINGRNGEFSRINGISFGAIVRHPSELEHYDDFLKKTITGSLEPALESMGKLEEFRKILKKTSVDFQEEYAPEVYSALVALKMMGFELIHFYVDELDLIENADPYVRTSFIHFFRDLGERMVNSDVPVAITLYATELAANIIEGIFSESHMPANMSISHIRLTAKRDEIKSIYKQRVSLRDWKTLDNKTIPLRAPSRDDLERRYSVFYPFTEKSIDHLYDLVARDLSEPELATLRPLFRIFHKGFWFMVNNKTTEPIEVKLAEKEYNSNWFHEIVEPVITGLTAPFQSLTAQEKDELRSKLGDLDHRDLWQLADMFSLYAQGLQKCVRSLDGEKMLSDFETPLREDQTERNFTYGSKFSLLSIRIDGKNRAELAVRLNIILFGEKFDLAKFSVARSSLTSKKPFAQLTIWVVSVLDPNIQYAKIATAEMTNPHEIFFYQNQDQILRVLSQSVVEDESRIKKEAELADIRELVNGLTTSVRSPKEIVAPAERPAPAFKNLLMTCLALVGRNGNAEIRRDDVVQLESNLLKKRDAYGDLEFSGFIELIEQIGTRYRMMIPPSIIKAVQLILAGKIQSKRDGEECFSNRWSDIESFLRLFQVMSPKAKFAVQGLEELDGRIQVLEKGAISLRENLSKGPIPAGVEEKFKRAWSCLKECKQKHQKLGDALKIDAEFTKYLVRSLEIFFAESAESFLGEVESVVEEQVPRIEVEPESLSETGQEGKELEKAVRIRNTGNQDLIIREIRTTGRQVFVEEQTPIRVHFGETHDLTVRLAFRGKPGTARGLVVLTTNDPSSPKKTINISAEVLASAKVVKIPIGPTSKPGTHQQKVVEMPIHEAILTVLKREKESDKLVKVLRETSLSDADIGLGLVKLLEQKMIKIAST